MSNFFDFLMSSYTTIEKIFLLIVLVFTLLGLSTLLSAVFNFIFKKEVDNIRLLTFGLYLMFISVFICSVCEIVFPTRNYITRNVKVSIIKK